MVARREGSFGEVPAETATALSLATTELCQNAIEHSLDSSSGNVIVRPHRTDDALVVDIVSDGKPLPEGFSLDNHRSSLGLSIVTTLMQDLGGTFTLEDNSDRVGTCARLVIPLQRL